jgi:hypothetical protein
VRLAVTDVAEALDDCLIGDRVGRIGGIHDAKPYDLPPVLFCILLQRSASVALGPKRTGNVASRDFGTTMQLYSQSDMESMCDAQVPGTADGGEDPPA